MWALATAKIDGNPTPCLRVNGSLFSFATLDPTLPRSLVEFFADWSSFAARLERLATACANGAASPISATNVELLAPLLYPGKVLCAGANYYDHTFLA